MALASFSFNEVALDALLNSPTGPLADEMRRVANTTLLEIARNYINRPWPGGYGPINPPPGPPYRRTGDLRDSLTVESSPSSPEATIVPTAIHRGANYGEILKNRGYRFLPDEFY